MSTLRARLQQRHGDDADQGVAMIELALALPFLVIMVLGLTSGGMAWQSVTHVNSAARAGGRVVSHDGKNASADFDAVTAINAALPTELRDRVRRVIVYKASATSDTVPSACLTQTTSNGGAGISGVCNIYNANQIRTAAVNNFGSSTSCAGKWDRFWCPKDRKADAGTAFPGDIDYIGVYIETVYEDVTNSFFGDHTIQRRVVFRIEPELAY
jgi:hypothetical protein